MSDPDRRAHWDEVYATRKFSEVSWYQAVPEAPLRLLRASGIGPDAPIIDIGGGASTLIDHLLDAGFEDLTVLDISERAFVQSRARLGDRAGRVHWIVSDVTTFKPERKYAVWHDRAVLHFLTDEADRQRYVEALRGALGPGGQLVISTFGPDGPQRCSGLEIQRYDIDRMQALLGPAFELCESEMENHATPTGGQQQFLYSRWLRRVC